MADDARAGGSQGDCSDGLALQKFIDGELPGPAAELVAHHLESCSQCRSGLADLKALSAFVQQRLGMEDEEEEEASRRILLTVASRLRDAGPQVTGKQTRAPWRQPVWIGAAAALLLVVLLSLPFGGRVDASAESILAENGAREHAWLYQPNQVLHWEARTVSSGIVNSPDGTERTVFWRRNGSSTFDEISRRYDDSGRTLWAYWQQPDGSSIGYTPATGQKVEVSPSTAALQAALPSLGLDLRDALEMFLMRRARSRSIPLESRLSAESLDQATDGKDGRRTSVGRVQSPEWGDVYRITAVVEHADRNTRLVRVVHEHDIEARQFRRVRLKSTLTYRDGSTGVHDTRWTAFRQSSEAEFESQVPRDLLQQGLPIIELTPLDIARRQRRETGGLRLGTR